MRRKIRTIFTLLSHRRGVRAVRRADGDPGRLQHGRGRRRRRSADDDPQGVVHSAAAATATRRGSRRRRASKRRHPRELVRRHLPGPEELLREIAVEPESCLQMYPEFELPADQKKAWLADRTGAVVGATRRSGSAGRSATASRCRRTIYRQARRTRRGSSPSTASTTAKKGVDKTQFFFHYDYLNETMRSAPARRIRSAGTSSGSTIQRRPIELAQADRRACSPTRRRRPRPRPRRRSSRLRQADRRHRQRS